ncbi:Uncharacterized protein SCF082_LOCUS44144, partial [Durusdinium trenchii]
KAQLFQGAAGGTAGALPRSEVGRRHVQHTESVETVSRGRKKLPSGRDRVGQLLTGEASPAHIAQRSHVGAASQVDDVVLHRDIDGSNLQFQEFAELMAGAAGRRCVGAQDRVEGKRHKEAVTSLVQEVFSPESPPLQAQRPARRRIPVAAASLVDDVVLDRDIDGSRQRFLDYAELTAGRWLSSGIAKLDKLEHLTKCCRPSMCRNAGTARWPCATKAPSSRCGFRFCRAQRR